MPSIPLSAAAVHSCLLPLDESIRLIYHSAVDGHLGGVHFERLGSVLPDACLYVDFGEQVPRLDGVYGSGVSGHRVHMRSPVLVTGSFPKCCLHGLSCPRCVRVLVAP